MNVTTGILVFIWNNLPAQGNVHGSAAMIVETTPLK